MEIPYGLQLVLRIAPPKGFEPMFPDPESGVLPVELWGNKTHEHNS